MKLRFSLFFLLLYLMARHSSAQTLEKDSLTLVDRMTIATHAYNGMKQYFAHAQDVPNLNPDSLYSAWLPKFISTPTRFEFALQMRSFIGNLHNGHSWYRDKWLTRNFNQPLGFTFRYLQGAWVVLSSDVKGLSAGDILEKINDTPFEEYFQQHKQYLNTGTENASRVVFAGDRDRFLFPLNFTITTNKGRSIQVNRKEKTENPIKVVSGRWIEPAKTAYIRARHLNGPQEELIEYLNQFKKAEALIIDVRGYAGGNTPDRFIDMLMDRPYRYWSESTSINFGLFDYYTRLGERLPANADAESKTFFGTFTDFFKGAGFIWPARYITPKNNIYEGRIFILVDGGVVSAKEDFVQPFKDNKRAIIIGEPTMGSTGQPYFFNYNSDIQVAIGTKRAYFPDGSRFENTGIMPDVLVTPTLKDIRSGKDQVLDKALELIQKH